MPTLTVPPEFPTGLSRGCLNGQAADASPVEAIERAIAHLCGGRRHSIPLWLMPRTLGTLLTTSIRPRFRRAAWTGEAILYLTYTTKTPWDRWILTIGGDATIDYIGIPPSPGVTVAEAVEVAVPFDMGTVIESEAGDFNLNLDFAFSWRDSAFVGIVAEEIILYSAFLSVAAVPQITGT